MTAGVPEVRAVEEWFDDRGLPYFVAGRAQAVEAWLGRLRIAVTLVVVLAASIGAGVWVARLTESGSLGGLTGVVLFVAILAAYAGRLLRIAVILRWVVRQTFGSLGLLLPLVTRGLPLLLLSITFLFVNTEVWQVASYLPRGRLWAIVLLFGAVATTFLVVRLPEEVRAVVRDVDADRVRQACAGTPAERLAADGQEVPPADLPRLARANLLLVLLFSQTLQVLLLAAAVLAFLLVFGSLAIGSEAAASWLGRGPRPLVLFGDLSVPFVSNDLFQVALFLSAFAGLYFTVYAVTDSTYREQFFSALSHELEQAVAAHAVYRAALTRSRG